MIPYFSFKDKILGMFCPLAFDTKVQFFTYKQVQFMLEDISSIVQDATYLLMDNENVN